MYQAEKQEQKKDGSGSSKDAEKSFITLTAISKQNKINEMKRNKIEKK